jgi:hypothetical protein
MPRHESDLEAEHRRVVERLVESVENGTVDALEDLSREEVALLLTRARPGESLEDLFDRLRPTAADRD